MRKTLPYILGAIMLAALVTLLFTGSFDKKKKLDERITLRRHDKIPYGTYAAYRNLKYLFPSASVFTSKYEPGYWDSLSSFDSRQMLIIICDRFNPDETEMDELIRFTENGNDVFVSARYISAAADKKLGCNSSALDFSFFQADNLRKKIKLSLLSPPFKNKSTFEYPGKTFDSYFTTIDESTSEE
ncbi:MAG: hypothetical protein ACRDEB_01510, partial [Chitinophagaceae bacterium]